MNGWETSSRPSWEPQEDPEDTEAPSASPSASASSPATESPWAKPTAEPWAKPSEDDSWAKSAWDDSWAKPSAGSWTQPSEATRTQPSQPSSWASETRSSWGDSPQADRTETAADSRRDGDSAPPEFFSSDYRPRDSAPAEDQGSAWPGVTASVPTDRPRQPSFEPVDRSRQPSVEPVDRSRQPSVDHNDDSADHGQEPSADDRTDPGRAARVDPALKDFFGPTAYRAEAARMAGEEHANGRPDQDRFGRRPAPPADTRVAPPPRLPSTQPPPGADAGRRKGRAAIGVVIGVAVALVVIVLTHMSVSSSDPGANAAPPLGGVVPTSTASTPVSPTATPTATAKKPKVTTVKYTLSTPATAGGYPMGQDPHFLATASTTASQVLAAVRSGGGGKAAGTTVSASYQLPTGQQVIEFVGYQGTFHPDKVATALGSIGSDLHAYPAGPHGGILDCVNTPATATSPSGAVCVWATSSTLGFTEFFSASGPEALTTSQSKGAADALKLRDGVEAKKK